ncbi:MAG: Fic family protein [Acidobacteriota bacterium]|nr:Fic family protein [Acidobacteriota bacterium]
MKDIDHLYDVLGYDYQCELNFERSRGGEDVRSRRLQFMENVCLRCQPSSEQIRRLFNQVNCSYAERYVLSHRDTAPEEVLDSLNELVLYRQGKRRGPRDRPIEFGARRDVDFVDPLRGYKVLQGTCPPHLADVVAVWCAAVDTVSRDYSHAIALTMCFIAIHPFSDGNGRVGRVLFTWLCHRWGLAVKWLAEGADGEVLRTGAGLLSTEHLMAQLMMRAADGHNRAFPYASHDSCGKAADALSHTLRNLDLLIETQQFRYLEEHMMTYRHFQDESPRFASLGEFMC